MSESYLIDLVLVYVRKLFFDLPSASVCQKVIFDLPSASVCHKVI